MSGGGIAEAFLGVERSLSDRRWKARASDDRAGLTLSQRLGLPEIVGRLLAARGIDVESADRHLNPTLRDHLPDPSLFRDMDRAAERLARAVRDGELIAIFGDYDVDGATSSALLRRFFEAAGARVVVYIPDRMKEGYGPNAPALLKLKRDGAGVAITVDCGTTAHDPLAAAAEAGLDVIVVDHHVAEPLLPRAFAVVNPNRIDESGEHGQLAAVGVAFMLIVAVNRALRKDNWYVGRVAPDLMRWLDLVALGTVCDVVPLTGINRALVAQGLKVLQRRGNLGIAALSDCAGVGERIDCYHVGFVLGPRVNAGGRVGRSDLGTRLLASEDEIEVRTLAAELHKLNAERRDIEAGVLEAAIEQAERHASCPIILVAAETWHPGVIGIVASRLKDRYNRPACVIALADGLGKGSGRSIPGLALGAAVIAARQAGLLISGGGHAMAAGFTVEEGRIDALRDFFAARMADLAIETGLVPELSIDGALSPAAATLEFVGLVDRLGPFGAGNSEPRFVLPQARIVRADIVGGQHVRVVLSDGAGQSRLKAIAFRSLDGELGAALLNGQGRSFHIAGHLRSDTWQGRDGVQLFIDDAAVPA